MWEGKGEGKSDRQTQADASPPHANTNSDKETNDTVKTVLKVANINSPWDPPRPLICCTYPWVAVCSVTSRDRSPHLP